MRVPVKGSPDFTAIPDSKLKGYVDLAQQMIFAYKGCSEETVKVLTTVWKQLSDEYTDRQSSVVEPEPVNNVVHKIKTVKRIKR